MTQEFRAVFVSALIYLFVCPLLLRAQRNGPQTPGQNAPGAQQGAGSASLQGLSWPQAVWNRDLGLPANIGSEKTVLACYTMLYGNSASQPLVLVPANTYQEREPFGTTCKTDAKGKLTATDENTVKRCNDAQAQKLADLDWASKRAQISLSEAQATANAQGASSGDKQAASNAQTVKDEADKHAKAAKDAKFKDLKWSYCANLDADHPIKMDQTLVIGIDVSGALSPRLKILNLNVTNQQGNPINPTPLRQSFTSSASSPTNAAPGPYYLTWPNEIPGDTIPTVSVNAVYTPPNPGAPWQPATFYPAGSVIGDALGSGHYFIAAAGGVSAPSPPPELLSPALATSSAAVVVDGSAQWLDSGYTQPQGTGAGGGGGGGSPVTLWQKTTAYTRGQVIFDPYNGHYYICLVAGTSGNAPTDPFSVPEGAPQPPVPLVVTDGDIIWQLDDQVKGPMPVPWKPHTHYSASTEAPGRVNASNKHIYKVARSTGQGNTGDVPTQPYFPVTPLNRATPELRSAAPFGLTIQWEDVGTTPPPSVTSGQPADQIVSLLNLQYAQSHSLSYYNLASGVMYSAARSQTFAFAGSGCSTTAASSCIPSVIGGSNTVDPVLLFTVYPWPWDSETRCKSNWCLFHFKANPPGFSFGLSLSSPSSSFYAGMSFEVLRNIQLVLASNFAKEARLPQGSVTQSSSAIMSGTPVTVQRFTVAPAFGLTLNISGFIQSLFGGGGGGGGGGGKGTGSQSSTPSSNSQ